MIDYYDSPEVRKEHEAEIIVLEQAKSSLKRIVSTLSKSDFQLNKTGEGIYAKPDIENNNNLALAEDLNQIRNFVAGISLNSNKHTSFSEAQMSDSEEDRSKYCFDVLKNIENEINYAKRLREADSEAPGEGDINFEVDMSIPGVKIGDASLRMNISNDDAGNIISFSIERPDREQIKNPNVISDKPIDLIPFQARLRALGNRPEFTSPPTSIDSQK